MVRRLFAVLTALLVGTLALPAVAAPKPVLVFFPFATAATVPASFATQLPDKIAAELQALGGVTVLTGDPTAKPENYRALARAAGADDYVTGSIVALGSSYAVLEELVSARAGVLLWSNSVVFRSVDDISGVGRTLLDLLAPPAAPSTAGTLPTTATPAPAAVATLNPTVGIVALPADGNSSRDERAFADQTVATAIKHLGFKLLALPKNRPSLPALCGQTHAQLLLATRLDMSHPVPKTGGTPQATAIVSLTAYDCTTRALDPNPVAVDHVAATSNDAIRAAITEAIVLLPALPPIPNS
jgi:TolB-like protein